MVPGNELVWLLCQPGSEDSRVGWQVVDALIVVELLPLFSCVIVMIIGTLDIMPCAQQAAQHSQEGSCRWRCRKVFLIRVFLTLASKRDISGAGFIPT